MSLAPYEDVENSEIEWVGMVPRNWSISKLGYFFLAPPCYGVLVPDHDPDGVPMLRITDMEHQFIDHTGLTRISPELSQQYSRTIVKSGDVVLSLVGTIGKAFEVSKKLEGVNLSRAIARLQLKERLLPSYLCWIFQSKSFSHFTDLVCRGTAQRVLNIADLIAFKFVFPTSAEQQVIARFLDHETAKIDALIQEQERLIELLQEKRQAVISHAVTKGLDPDVPMKDSGVEWLGEVPAHWVVAGFKKHLEPIVDYRGKTPTKTYSGAFLVTARNIKDGVINYSLSQEFIPESDYEEVMRRGAPRIGDVLFTTEAPLGEVAQVDDETIALAQRIIKFRGLPGVIDNSYLKLFLESAPFQNGLMIFATGSTALGIKSDRLGYLWQLVPPFVEQQEIVKLVTQKVKKYKQLIASVKEAIALMRERRSALIAAAVTGKIDVRNWQPPSDESAFDEEVRQAGMETTA